jgi:hypothetical protein
MAIAVPQPAAPAHAPSTAPQHRRIAWLPVGVIALVKFVATMAFINRYGFHRDELYYLDSSRHLALGYVDYPPLTPFLARLDMLVFGVSLPGLRLLVVLAGVALILLTARITLELGGGMYAQVLACLALLFAPMMLGANTVFETVSFDQLAWAGVFFLVVRLVNTGNPRLWLAIGAAMGVGLMTKQTIVVLVLGLAIGVLLTSVRRDLATPWPWLGALLALAILSPNLVWQVQHGWPTLSYIGTHHSRISGDTSRPSYILEQIVLVGPLAVPLLFIGYVELFKRSQYRVLFWACVVAELSMLVAGGKSYYPGPTYSILFAAGAVRASSIFSTGWWRWLRPAMPVLIALTGLALLPLSLPVLSSQAMTSSGIWNTRSDYADETGWPEYIATIARVYDRVPAADRASTAILTGNYGEAGAIDYLGARYHLPQAISGHLTYYYWKPAHVRASWLIAVEIAPSQLRQLYRHVVQAAVVRNSLGMHNSEWGNPVYLCWGQRVDINRIWSQFQHYD